ncbi:hypothetical protein E8E14_000109 [Neopestalotiopsis sp. 37M]|nr:hypothetical protein E8E14_000109 [Neopestalotiopsis sp. 37M]
MTSIESDALMTSVHAEVTVAPIVSVPPKVARPSEAEPHHIGNGFLVVIGRALEDNECDPDNELEEMEIYTFPGEQDQICGAAVVLRATKEIYAKENGPDALCVAVSGIGTWVEHCSPSRMVTGWENFVAHRDQPAPHIPGPGIGYYQPTGIDYSQ